MSVLEPKSDSDLLALLKAAGTMGVKQLAEAMEVTPTAIRQRLIRLHSKGMIQREAFPKGRGRPKHRYWMTDKGMEAAGSSLDDLATALWAEVRREDSAALHQETLRRIAGTLAASCKGKIEGVEPLERLQSVARYLTERNTPSTVGDQAQGAVLTIHGRLFPSLSASDKEICEVERMMLSELIGQEFHIVKCRSAEDAECQFQAD